ncbi:MAG: DUF2608 domain-containing protein [Verrucomicrobia bacterium]|nr:DUF2608 domain-containing protein [Verrucomicrobiota bacterium]
MLRFVIAILLLTSLEARILETSDLTLFEQHLVDCDQRSLVLFDVDNTLIFPKDQVVRSSARKVWKKHAQDTIENPAVYGQEHWNEPYFFGQMLTQAEFEIVDPRVVELIHSLQQREIKTIAFTRMSAGSLGSIPSMEDWRIGHLKSYDIDFSPAFPLLHEMKTASLAPSGRSAVFKQGVLCANVQDKGPVLVAFLDCVGWRPSRVFFLDDRLDYLQSVETSLEGTGIEFIGFHYTAVEQLPSYLDEEVARYQLTHLAQTGLWLSDEEAVKRLPSAS